MSTELKKESAQKITVPFYSAYKAFSFPNKEIGIGLATDKHNAQSDTLVELSFLKENRLRKITREMFAKSQANSWVNYQRGVRINYYPLSALQAV